MVYNRQTTAKQPAEAIETSQSVEQNGTQSPSSLIDVPTPNVPSENKDTNSVPNVQELEQKNNAITIAENAGIKENDFAKQLRNENPAEYNTFNALAKLLGLEIEFVESVGEGNALIVGNKMQVAYNPANREETLRFLIGHESLHRLKQIAPEAYAELMEDVKAHLGEELFGQRVERLRVRYEHQGIAITEESLEEEVVADFIGEMEEDYNVVSDLATQNPNKSWWQKLIEGLRNLFSFLEEAEADTAKVASILNKIETAYKAASEKVQTLEVETVNGEVSAEEVKNSLREGTDEATDKIFATAKAKFGTTYDIREAGWILPDGSMLDFSGKHEIQDANTSFLNGRRTVDHRAIQDIAYDFDENETGVKTDLGDFLDRGAIRIDYNAGSINLNVAPTKAQKDRLKRLIERNDGDVYIDFGKGWNTEYYVEYESARPTRVLGDIDRYFDEGIKPMGNVQYSLKEVNDTFNEQLATLTEENARESILNIGMPSPALLAAGITKKPIRLYGAKLLSKVRKHGYKIADLKDLPIALSEPIAVFTGSHDGSYAVLTELHIDDNNVLATLSIGKGGHDVDFNIISSVYDKREDSIARWVNNGKMLWVDKKKALDYFSDSAPLAEAQNNQELVSITKIVQNFENPNIEPKYSLKDTFYSNAELAVRNIKQEKATPEQWLKMIEKNGGLKAGEDKWLGLSDWLKASDKKTLTKDEVLDYIHQNQIQIEEVEYTADAVGFDALKAEYDALLRNEGYDAAHDTMIDRFGDDFDIAFSDLGGELIIENEEAAAALLGSGNIINSTRLDYTTKGLEDKREIALTVPTIEPWNTNDEIHFGDAGGGRAVAWIRFGETTDAEGKRVLVIDEIQSRRHQEGREKGYISDEVLEAQRQYDYLYRKMYREGLSEEEHNRYYSLGQFIKENYGIVPSAPFEKNWAELAMKRILRYAAENGYDKVAWTTGDQQSERYDLSHMVDYIDAERNVDGTYNINVATTDDSHYVQETNIAENKLSELVGKDIAFGIISSIENSNSNKAHIEADDMTIGGSGMKAFYDQMLPSFVRKYGKKWGATVGEVTMPNLKENNTMHSVDVTPAMRESVMQGQPMFSLRDLTEEEQNIIATAKANGTYLKAPNGADTNLTPEQWVMVRTKAFKDWFGDWENDPENASKIVDENGEPMVMAHGSKNNFTVFRSLSPRGTSGRGMYFAKAPNNLDNFGYNNGVVYLCFLNVRHPYTSELGYSRYKGTDAAAYTKDDSGQSIDEAIMNLIIGANSYEQFIDDYNQLKDNRRLPSINNISKERFQKIHNYFDGKGIYGYELHTKKRLLGKNKVSMTIDPNMIGEVVVRDATQIKSATDNVGTFDVNNPDIRYSLRNPEWQSQFGVPLADGKELSLEDVRTIFGNTNSDTLLGEIFDRVYAVMEKLPRKVIKVVEELPDKRDVLGTASTKGDVTYLTVLFKDYGEQAIAEVLLHELIHSVTTYATHAYAYQAKGDNYAKAYDALPAEIKKACRELQSVYNRLSKKNDLKGAYGIKNIHEMLAELSNPQFRTLVKEGGFWNVLLNAIKRMLGFEGTYNAELKELDNILSSFLENYNEEAYMDAVESIYGEDIFTTIEEVDAKETDNQGKEVKYSVKELTEEEQNIIATAKANGTYLKAPNGADTNLTPRQWVMVRTKAFKKWFGDWELAAIAEYLTSDDVVAILNGDEFAKDGTPLTDKVVKYYADNHNGKVERDGLGEVLLDKRSVKDSASHGLGKAKSAAFAAVPNIITEGRIIDSQTNWKGRGYDSVTIAAPIRIGNENYVGVVVVKKSKEFNRFYLHEVMIQKSLRDGVFQTSLNAGNPSGDIAKVIKNIINANNSSKIVDANGEPKIVEHSTWNDDFYTFDINHLGESSGDEGVYGAGFYFGNVGETELYGDRAIQVYLNLHNPLVLPDAPIKGFFDYLVENFDKEGLRDIVVKQGNNTATMGDVVDAIKAVNEAHAQGEYAELIEQMSQYWMGAEGRVLEQQIFRKIGFAIYPTLEPFIQYNVGRKEFSEALRNAGYDGVVYNNQEYVAFEPNQIKSADPVTYDDAGNIIPLSERFNPKKEDIRYSLREATGEKLTPAMIRHHMMENVTRRQEWAKYVVKVNNLLIVFNGNFAYHILIE